MLYRLPLAIATRLATARPVPKSSSLLRIDPYKCSPSTASYISTSTLRKQDPEDAVQTAEAPLIRYFNPDLPSVDVRRSDGSVSRYNILPIPKANNKKLKRALEELLGGPESTGAASEDANFTRRWILDGKGDAIHRHMTFQNEDEAHNFQAAFLAAANDMNHHPHIVGSSKMTVTCTTHNPRGLSMRDIRLAKKADELASKYEVPDRPDYEHHSSVLDQQRKQRETNRQLIDDAVSKQQGACFTTDQKAPSN